MSSVIDMIARCAQHQPDTAIAPRYEDIVAAYSTEACPPTSNEYIQPEEIVINVLEIA